MLDEDDADAHLLLDVQDEAGHVLLLVQVHAGHGLVQEQQLRLQGQGAAQLHSLLQAVGQGAGGHLPYVLDLEEVNDALHHLAVAYLLRLGQAPVEGASEDARAHLHVPPQHDVVQHAHAPEEGQVLEGAGDAQGGDAVGPQVGDVPPLEEDAAPLGMVVAADGVDEGGLAGAVGADDGQDLAPVGLEAHPAQGVHPAERQVHILHFEQRRLCHLCPPLWAASILCEPTGQLSRGRQRSHNPATPHHPCRPCFP